MRRFGKNVTGDIKVPKGVYKANVAGIFKDYDPNTWIKFGALLAMIQKICNIKDEKGGSYLLNFDLNWDDLKKDTTFMATFPVSPAPQIITWVFSFFMLLSIFLLLKIRPSSFSTTNLVIVDTQTEMVTIPPNKIKITMILP